MQIDQKQSTPPKQDDTKNSELAGQDQAKKKAAEDQADNFSEKLGKKKKGKKEGKGLSLNSLIAERNRNSREMQAQKNLEDEKKLRSGHEGGGEPQDHLIDMSFAQIKENTIKGELQIKEIQQSKSVKEIEASLLKMSDKIYVSAKDAVNGSEIRISIKDNILPATDVRINRNGGELTVTMNTTSAETHNLLAQHQASLQKHLDDRFSNENVQVNFNMAGDANDESEDGSRNEYVEDDSNDDKDEKSDKTV